jgi:hypothetical protein
MASKTVTNQQTTFDADTNDDITVSTNSGNLDDHTQRVAIATDDVNLSGILADTANMDTNLGTVASAIQTIDAVVGATDKGFAMLGKHVEDQVHSEVSDGDYEVLSLDSLGSLHVNAEAHHVFDSFNATTGWSALSNDTLNLATTAKHVSGTAALTFDKVDGAANTVFAGIEKTLTSVDLGAISPHDLLQGCFYIPDLTNVSYAFLRIGTDSSNYNEWRLPDDALTAATFEVGAQSIGDVNYAGITGNGWNPSAITYIAVGVAFDSETDTLAGIVFDEVSYHTNQHTSAIIGSEVTSSVSSANINLLKIGNKVVDTQAGNVSTGTQRITIATDDANLAAINTNTTLATGITAGAKTVASAGTAETLVAGSTPCKKVIMTAEDNNTGKIFYGGATVSSSLGDFLQPGQKVEIEIDDVQKIYIDAGTSTDGVRFTYTS